MFIANTPKSHRCVGAKQFYFLISQSGLDVFHLCLATQYGAHASPRITLPADADPTQST